MRCSVLLWCVVVIGCLGGGCCQSVEPPLNATAEWNASDRLDHILLSSIYSPSSSSASTSLAPSIAAAPLTPFIRPLLAVGDVVGPTASVVSSQRGSRFQLVQFIQAIPAPYPTSSSSASIAGLLPSSASAAANDKSLSFASTVLSRRSAQQVLASPSQALVSARDSLSLRQFERLVSLPYLSLAPSYLDADDSLLHSALSPTVTASVPSVSSATSAGSTSSSSASFDYTLHSRIGRGGYGELWKARKLPTTTAADEGSSDSDSDSESESEEYYILKRLLIEKGEHVRASGLREIQYGQLLSDQPHIARYIEWFEVRGELWLVFRHEGMSVADYIRRVEAAAHGGATEEAGREVLTPEWQLLREDMMSADERWAWNERRRRDSRQTDSEPVDDDMEHDTVDLDVLEHAVPSLLPPVPAATSALSALLSAASAVSTPAPRNQSASDTSSSSSGLPAGSLLRDLLHQLMTGIAEGHRLGVTHRDIKPQNILLKLHRHHPHHRFLHHRHSHDFLSVDEETSEQQSEHHHNDTVETRSHLHDLPSPDTSSNGASPTSSLLSSRPSSASFSFSAALSSLGHVRLCDYGSATDASEEVNQRLYDANGPSLLESTIDYAPPELLFSSSMSAAPSSTSLSSFFTPSYDSWSLGVLVLELLLGSRERVFALDGRVKALIQARLGHRVREDVVEKAILFRAFIEYCIYPATTGPAAGPSDSACNHTHVADMLRRYDPLGVGLGDLSELDGPGRVASGVGGVRLSVLLYTMVRGLLQWHPHLRLSVEDALQHAYFHGDWYRCVVCNEQFELPGLLQAHSHTHVERRARNGT